VTTPPAPFTPALPALAATNPATIHLYCRVSSDEQKNYGSSLDVQERDLNEFVERHFPNVQIRAWKEGGVSGNKRLAQRRVGCDMLAALQPGDLVICTKQDRLFRNNIDAQLTLEDFT
jgi:DNA invertase Pin-like site-specific DNA recombinase